jgi:hypothetical protein
MPEVERGPSLSEMRKTFPIVWALHDRTHTGKFEAFKERLELSSRGYTLSFPRSSVTHFMIERGAGKRIRGLSAITIRLAGGEVVQIASLGGPGSLHEIAELLTTAEDPGWVPRQELAGTGT